MNENKLVIAVVGCGQQGQDHIRHLLSESAVGSVTAVDLNPQTLRQVEDKFKIRTAEDFYRVLKEPVLDAVVIASNNQTHPPFALAALAAGKDVLCEKPLAPTLAECRQMVEAARKSRRILHCHFELRHSVVPSRLKAILDSGEIGELRSLNMIHYRGPFRPAWKGDPSKSGGLALMETCHAVDLCRYFSGSEVRELQSFAPPISIPYYGFADTEYLVLKMERGIIAHLTTCHTRSADEKIGGFDGSEWEEKKYGHQYEYNILGSRGAIWYDALRSQGLSIFHHTGQGEKWQCRLDRVEDLTHVPFEYQIHGSDVPEFVKAVVERRSETHIRPEDALKTHEVCFAIERSRQLDGQAVRPGEL